MSENNTFEKYLLGSQQGNEIKEDREFEKQDFAELSQKIPTEQAGQNQQEEQEREKKLENDFAKELEKTPKGKFFKKLQKIAGAFILAGLVLFSPREGIAPEPSEEVKAIESLCEKNYQSDLREKILKQISEKGGVVSSPQLPEEIYRSSEVASYTLMIAMAGRGQPFYNRPEVILGEKFIKENPGEAKKYYEKIATAIKATVMLWDEEGSQGSGVIIKGAKNKLILTNAHVCGKNDSLIAVFANKKTTRGMAKSIRVIAKNEIDDVAVLEIPAGLEELLEGTEVLEIEKNKDPIWNGETLAVVGNPLGFPFAVGIAEGKLFLTHEGLFYSPDKRFSHLELYVNREYTEISKIESTIHAEEDSPTNGSAKKIKIPKVIPVRKTYSKGDSIPGMSGGPLISLEAKGRPKLIGITKAGYGDSRKREDMLGVAVPAEDIVKFLKDNNLI